jgi:fucose permease
MADHAAASALRPTSIPDARVEWASLHAGFILIGVSMTMLATVLPYFTQRWSLSAGQAGFFFTALYFASFVGTLLTSPILPRFGFSKVIGAGHFLFFLGLLFFGLGPWYFSAVCVAVYGLGYGFLNPSINLRATQLPSKNVAAAVGLLNFTWGIGAMFSPVLVVFFQGHWGLRSLTLLLAAGFAALSAFSFLLKPGPSAPLEQQPKRSFSVWRTRLHGTPWIFLIQLFFFYVGIEVSVGGWVALHAKNMPGITPARMAAAPLIFYGFLLLGRLLLPVTLKLFSQRRICLSGLVLIIAGVSLVFFSHSPVLLYTGTLLAGFGCAPQYPIYVTWIASIFKSDSAWLGALFFGATGLGGSAIPWAVGVIASQTHSLRLGFLLPLCAALWLVPVVLRACPDPAPANA